LWSNSKASVFTALLLSQIPVKVGTLHPKVKGWDHLNEKAKRRKTYRVLDRLIEEGFVRRTKVGNFYHYYPTKLGLINYKVNVINRLEALNG